MKGWVGIPDVFINHAQRAIAVPRRRVGAAYWAMVIHEVAHLQLWDETGRTPTKQKDWEVCRLALRMAYEYGFGHDTLRLLEQDLAEQLAETIRALKDEP